MKKKVISIALIIALIAVIAAGSFAYFTDKDKATNTFTVGNVDIRLIESTFHREGNDNSGDKSIPDPTHIADGMKYVANGHKAFTDDEIQADAENYKTYLENAGNLMTPGRAAAKCPYVINDGKTAAYVRIRVLVPSAANRDYVAVENGGVITNQWCSTSMLSGEFAPAAGSDRDPVINKGVTYEGKTYDEYVFVRNEALAPGAMTEWNVWNFIGIDADADNADIQKAIDAGAITKDGSFGVLVFADAIQAEGFANATAAFAAFDAQK